MDLGRALDQGHLSAQRGQQESVAAEARGGVDDGRGSPAGEARSAGQVLAAPAAKAKAVADRAADEVDGQVL